MSCPDCDTSLLPPERRYTMPYERPPRRTLFVFTPFCRLLDWLNRRDTKLQSMETRIMSKLSELKNTLVKIDAKLDKAHAEIVAKIQALETTLHDVDLPEDAQAALDELSAAAKTLDDVVPDAG